MKTNRNSKMILWLFGGYILSTLLMLLATPLTKALGITSPDNEFSLGDIAEFEKDTTSAARLAFNGSSPYKQNDDGRIGARAAVDYATRLWAARVQDPNFTAMVTDGTRFGPGEMGPFWRTAVGT